MSAYVVDNQTISDIVDFINHYRSENKFITRHIVDRYHVGDDDKDRQNFGQKLLEMNINAVDQRYKDHDNYENPPFMLCSGKYSKRDIYKSLATFLYQCSEGDVPETELFKMMQKYHDRLAHDIVSDIIYG